MTRRLRTLDARSFVSTAALVMAATLAGLAHAQSAGEPGRGTASPNPLKNVYFGEQHLHTSTSVDA